MSETARHWHSKRSVRVVGSALMAAAIFVYLHFKSRPLTESTDLLARPSPKRWPIQFPAPSAADQIAILDPYAVLKGAHTADPALREWILQYQDSIVHGHAVNQHDLQRLDKILADSPLDFVEMSDLAHAFHAFSGDGPTTAHFYDVASLRIERELPADKGIDIKASIQIVFAIQRHLEDFKHVLWPMIENSSRVEYAKSIFRVYDSYIRIAKESRDFSLIRSAAHPAIGACECLYLLGRYDEARSRLGVLYKDQLTPMEALTKTWTLGLIAYRTADYSAAESDFIACAANPQFQYAKRAEVMQVATLAKSGDKAKAKALIAELILKQNLSQRQVAELLMFVENPERGVDFGSN